MPHRRPKGQAAASASETETAEVHVEAFAVLQKYLNTLRRDSYTKQPLVEDCVTITRYSYKEGVQRPAKGALFPSDEVKYGAEFDFPPCCRLRRSFKAADRSSASEAKHMVAKQAIEALLACGQLWEDRCPKRPARLELPQPQEACLPLVLKDIAPGAELALYRLTVQGTVDNCHFGLLSTWHSMYAFQLEAEALQPYCQGHPASDGEAHRQGTIRVEPLEMGSRLDVEQDKAARVFHEKAVGGRGDDRACQVILAVCLTERGSIDWEAMRDQRPVPSWLGELHKRVLRLQGLELRCIHLRDSILESLRFAIQSHLTACD